MKERLLILEKHLQKVDAPVLKYLNKGLSEGEVKPFFANCFPGLDIHQDIIDIFSWHNGTEEDYTLPSGLFHIFPPIKFSSLEDIIRIYDSEDLDKIFKFKDNHYLPLFTSDNSEFIVINLKEYIQDSKNSKLIFANAVFPDLDTFTSIYDNLEQMLDTVNYLYEKGVYFLNKDEKMLDYDDKYWEITKKMNPNSDYWKR